MAGLPEGSRNRGPQAPDNAGLENPDPELRSRRKALPLLQQAGFGEELWQSGQSRVVRVTW